MIENKMRPEARLGGLLRLFRFELPFTAGVCVILGELLALDKVPTLYEMGLGFFSVFCISATSLILNDYFDIESDKVNAPDRPLPAGLVTKQDVVLPSCVVTALGFITGALISFPALLFVILTIGGGAPSSFAPWLAILIGSIAAVVYQGVSFIFNR